MTDAAALYDVDTAGQARCRSCALLGGQHELGCPIGELARELEAARAQLAYTYAALFEALDAVSARLRPPVAEAP